MSDTIPPSCQHDPDAQFARLEAAKTYLLAALEMLCEHQEHEHMAGNREASDEIARLKELAHEAQDTVEDYMGEMISMRPLDEAIARNEGQWVNR